GRGAEGGRRAIDRGRRGAEHALVLGAEGAVGLHPCAVAADVRLDALVPELDVAEALVRRPEVGARDRFGLAVVVLLPARGGQRRRARDREGGEGDREDGGLLLHRSGSLVYWQKEGWVATAAIAASIVPLAMNADMHSSKIGPSHTFSSRA